MGFTSLRQVKSISVIDVVIVAPKQEQRKMLKLPNQKINCYMDTGGCGDAIARLPAIKYILNHNEHLSMDLWVPEYFVDLCRHLLINHLDRCAVMSVNRMPLLLDQNIPSITFKNEYCTPLRMHLVDNAFQILNGTHDVAPEHKNYPRLRLEDIDTTHFNLEPNTYVALTPAFTSKTRELPAQTYNEIAGYLVTRGYTPVWLGAREEKIPIGHRPQSVYTEHIDYTIGRDLRDQTTLLEAAKIMALAKAVVGLDNGLLHLAACSDVPLVAAYSMVAPEIRLPYRRGTLGWNCQVVEPEESLACRYCQSQFNFLFSHDYRTCYTGTLDCTKQLTSKKFIEKLAL